MRLKKLSESTAARREIKFEIVDTNGDPLASATNIVVELCKAGATAWSAAAGTVSEVTSGVGSYVFNPAAADLNTLGEMMVKITADGARTQKIPVLVVAFDPFNANNMGMAYMSQDQPANFALLGIDGDGDVDVNPASFTITIGDMEIETGLTMKDALRIIAAVLAGAVAGATSDEITFNKLDPTGKTSVSGDLRLTVGVDQHGNRSGIVMNLP